MNVGGDIAQLSYKELQALALRYRVPGNIKKKVLVKVLQAARSGNEAEFSRLLQELRKNRKRKTRKKDLKLGITSTPLHSPDYIMADDDYYCQQQPQQSQQQPSYQWYFPLLQIGAEEEIASKEDDNRIPHYEEFKQFLLKRIQREFQTCDANNNQIENLSVVDLRTANTVSPNVQTISLDVPNNSKTNLINEADPLAISTVDRPSYQMLKEPEGSSQGSFLLKRMLQAPVGANLGEIASSLFWAGNLLDTSDTLTAESENNENEDQLETATDANEYYGLLKNAKNEFLLNETNLRNVETLVPQVPDQILTSEEQYKYSSDVDSRQNYQNWTVTSVMQMPESDLQSSKMFHTIYYNNAEPPVVNTDNNLPYQYQANTEATCNNNQNFLNFENGYAPATGADMMGIGDVTDMYYLQNIGKYSGDIGAEYFRNVEPLVQNNAQQQNIYTNCQQQAFSNSVRGTASDATHHYLYPRLTHQMDNALHERLENQQSGIVTAMENNVNQEIDAANIHGSANAGTVEPFWPKWNAHNGSNNNLENILNYHVSKQVDYAKLGQTSCVYCYVAPIISQRSSLTNNACSQARRYTAEQRQHSFSPYWMLYNDTSQGMRMTNISSSSLPEQFAMTTTMTKTMHMTTIPDDDLKENDTEAPINDVWMNQYEHSSIVEEINIQATDSLFCNITDRIDDIPTPDIAKP